VTKCEFSRNPYEGKQHFSVHKCSKILKLKSLLKITYLCLFMKKTFWRFTIKVNLKPIIHKEEGN
jgi:hypothetical protein